MGADLLMAVSEEVRPRRAGGIREDQAGDGAPELIQAILTIGTEIATVDDSTVLTRIITIIRLVVTSLIATLSAVKLLRCFLQFLLHLQRRIPFSIWFFLSTTFSATNS